MVCRLVHAVVRGWLCVVVRELLVRAVVRGWLVSAVACGWLVYVVVRGRVVRVVVRGRVVRVVMCGQVVRVVVCGWLIRVVVCGWLIRVVACGWLVCMDARRSLVRSVMRGDGRRQPVVHVHCARVVGFGVIVAPLAFAVGFCHVRLDFPRGRRQLARITGLNLPVPRLLAVRLRNICGHQGNNKQQPCQNTGRSIKAKHARARAYTYRTTEICSSGLCEYLPSLVPGGYLMPMSRMPLNVPIPLMSCKVT